MLLTYNSTVKHVLQAARESGACAPALHVSSFAIFVYICPEFCAAFTQLLLKLVHAALTIS